jgi:hypothetical protein
MVKLSRCLVVALVVSMVVGCAATRRQPPPPAYFTQVTPKGIHYTHNWEDRPCFSIDLAGLMWNLTQAGPDKVVWRQGNHVLQVYLVDNRKSRFAVKGMDAEGALRAFIAYELDFVKPRFEMQLTRPPRIAQDHNGVWAQWGWEGHGGKTYGLGDTEPADQRHIIASLWVDPWVLSFDWATTDLSSDPHMTPQMVDVLESLQFHPQCYQTMVPGETLQNVGPPREGATLPTVRVETEKGGASKHPAKAPATSTTPTTPATPPAPAQ